MTLAFILVLIFISAVALLNNKYLNNGQIIKTIYVKNRVINYIIKA